MVWKRELRKKEKEKHTIQSQRANNIKLSRSLSAPAEAQAKKKTPGKVAQCGGDTGSDNPGQHS